MAWTYISSMDEYDKEVSKDSTTKDRYTFRRYLYFKPSQYDQWKKGGIYSGIPYTAELVGNPNIPSAGTYLTGSLSSFYVNDVVSISNLSEQEHGDHCSYARVTIEYENKKANGNGDNGGESSAQSSRGLKPWERKVDDFQITNQEVSVPLTEAFEYDSLEVEPISTTAGQVLYGFTTSIWIQRLTWTFYSKDSNYSIPSGIINSSEVTLFDKITIPAGYGLLLPPGYRKMYWYKDDNDTSPTEYDQWSFEIIVNTAKGFDIDVINAGTKAIFDKELVDICTWYVYDPESSEVPEKKFGSFADMMDAKKQVDQYNLNIQDETRKKVWNGDFIQSPIPLDEFGYIDETAIEDASQTYIKTYMQYNAGTWNLGIR